MSIRRAAVVAIFFSAFGLQASAFLQACPFCNVVEPAFAERRADSDVVVIAEATEEVDTTGKLRRYSIRQSLKGADALGTTTNVAAADLVESAGLALLLRRGEASWDVIPVDETSLAYFVRSPDARLPAAERLPYFTKFLEHPDPAIADDAFREYGRAPFDAVVAVAAGFPYESFRRLLVDPAVLDERKGFYGLALGLATDAAQRAANVALLRKLVTAETTDFRAGFDGILGGLLWAEGPAALDLIDARFLDNPDAAEGDVRHVQRALRFYLQYGRAIPEARLIRSVARLLSRPGTAAEALADLTRRKAWSYAEQAERLFLQSSGDDPALDRAAANYLLLSPQPDAAAALRRLKQAEPERMQDALRRGAILGVRE